MVGVAVGAAMSKPGRKALFWGFCIPMLPFAVVGVLRLVDDRAGGRSRGGVGRWAGVRARPAPAAVVARPELTHEMRAALAARGLRPIPHRDSRPGRAARAMRRQLGRGRLSQPVVKVPDRGPHRRSPHRRG